MFKMFPKMGMILKGAKGELQKRFALKAKTNK